jgi:hypothetical protein
MLKLTTFYGLIRIFANEHTNQIIFFESIVGLIFLHFLENSSDLIKWQLFFEIVTQCI